MECYERVDKQGLDFEIDYRVLRFDGEVRHIRELGTAVFDDTGQFTGHTGTHQDITELREREIALRESEQRYREIFEESPVGIWEDDWSDVKRMLDHLAAGGVTDLRKHFHDNPDKLMEVYDQVKHIDIGRSTIELYGAPSKQTLKDWLRAKVVTDEELDGFLECLIAFRNGEFSFEYDAPQLRFDGALFVTSNSVVIPLQSRHDWSRVFYAIENITERKQAEKDRQQSVQRLEDIAAAASDWFWEMDADLRFTYISDRYEEVAGISSDFFFGKRMDESYPRSVKKFPLAWKTYFEAVAERRDFRDFVHDDIRRDGLRRVISNTGKAIFDEDGNFQGYRGTSTDITDQRVAEEALRDSQAMLTDAIESISEGFVLYDSEERLVICNDNYRKSFPMVAELMVPGAKLEDLLRIAGERGQVKHDMVSVEDWIEQRLEEYHSDGHEPIEQQLSDGRWILAGERRTREGGIVGIRTDITDVKRAEEAVRTRDAWLKGILENSPLEIVLKDTAGRIMATSRTVQEAHGLSREKMVGLRSSDFLPAELAEIYMSADRKVMETGKLFQQEVSENREDGSIRHMLNAKFPLKDDEGHILGTCSLATDITEMKQVQAQLHQAQKMEAVGKLTGGIAHDFNNLLAIVMGNLELIEEESKDSDSIALYLAAAFTAADNAATLTHRLLAFSRNQPLMPKIVDTNSLVSKMLGLLERTLEEDIVIVADYGDDLAPVSIDSGQLENALLNLVVNARDAMPKGGKIFIETDSVTVDRAAAENDHGLSPGDYISLTVRDTGDGMPQDVLDHAFEPFFTTKGVGEGSGLGLSMVFGFANQSGGNVEISSEQGHGTAVTLYLPATTAEITDIEKPDPDVVKDGGGKTILFVDDNEEVSRVVVAQLTSMGFKVHQAHDGKSALDALDKFPAIDLLLTDVKMPGGMDGAELALEARCRRPRLPVLYASGYSADALKKSGQLEDNAQLIEKPFKRRALAARIASMLS
jgi:PAS domain S-box-containing protein